MALGRQKFISMLRDCASKTKHFIEHTIGLWVIALALHVAVVYWYGVCSTFGIDYSVVHDIYRDCNQRQKSSYHEGWIVIRTLRSIQGFEGERDV